MTAKELINKRLYVTDDGEPESVHDSVSNVKDTMIEFAKYHVEKALKASHSNFQLPEEEIDFTLDAYPLENIK